MVRDDVLGPMMIDQAGRQIGDFVAGAHDSCFAVHIRKAHDRIGVGDVKVMAD
jgi:hypothetical protein